MPADTLLTFSLLSFLAWRSKAQFTSSRNFYPAAYPLAVRSPYLNAWIQSPKDTTTFESWPYHWDDKNIMGVAGFVRVDGKSFGWMGDTSSENQTSLVSTEVTPTRSKFTILAGRVQLNVTFLSPIEPSNWVLQSLPFTYISIEVATTDGSPHNVQVYFDTSAEWVSGDRSKLARWTTTVSDGTAYHQATLFQQSSMSEINNVAEDSTMYFGMASSSSSSWQTGADAAIRQQFIRDGTLNNTMDISFRAIKDYFVVFAHAVDLGNITKSSSPTVWSLGLVRDPVITFSAGVNSHARSPYFLTHFSTVDDAVKFFIKDYKNAVKRADELDFKIMKDASVISSNYADLVAFGARQTMAGIDITVPRGTDGKWNMSDVKAFMKDTGTSQRINPVEGLFSAFPAFLYLNSSLGGLLLDPLLEFQAYVGNRQFSAPDLGSYPRATGNTSNANNTALESTGNMLVMALAHAQLSGDGTLVSRYYDLLKGWTDYLSAHTLHPQNQHSADGLDRSDQSNLAIKGIIGIAAMAKISKALNRESDYQTYSAKASNLSARWTKLATSGDHITSVYGDSQSRPLVYNLYADVLLRTNVVDSSIYSQQTRFYKTLTTTAQAFGLPYDDIAQEAQDFAKAPWTIFTAATVTQNETQGKLIDMVHARATFNGTRGDFPTTYRVSNGSVLVNSGQASPSQGAMFALLALSLPIQNMVAPPDAFSHAVQAAGLNGGTIAGAVIGTFGGIGLLALGFLLWWKRRKTLLQQESLKPIPFVPHMLYRQRAPDSVEMNLMYQNTPHRAVRGVLPADTSSDFSIPESEEPELTDLISHQPSQSVTNSNSTMHTTDTSQLRHEIATLRQHMNALQAHQEEIYFTSLPRHGTPPVIKP